MKTSFDHKTAKKTYARFVKLKSSFRDSKTKLDAMFSKVENEAICLIENGAIHHYFENEMKQKETSEEPFSPLLRKLYVCKSILDYQKKEKNFVTLYDESISELLKKSKPLTNSFRWFLSSRKAKEEATQSFKELMVVKESSEIKTLFDSYLRLSEVDQTDPKIIKNDFLKNKKRYSQILKKAFPEAFSYGEEIPMKKLSEQYKSIVQKINDIQKGAETVLKKADKNVDELSFAQINEFLEGKTISELYKIDKNLKLTPFSKAGCHYLKDLIALMPRLKKTSYIRGLYKTDIEKIDTAIDTYFQNNSSECQVEIPPLAPSNVHLEFINAIYKSVSLENIFLEMDPTINKLRTTADDINSLVKEIKNSFVWLFYSEIEKQDFKKKYNSISSSLDECERSKIQVWYKRYQQIKKTNLEESWGDFKKDTLKYTDFIERFFPGFLKIKSEKETTKTVTRTKQTPKKKTQTKSVPVSVDIASDYYKKLMKMSYQELVQLLLKKYGPAKYDYFVNERCISKNSKISRTNEGLFCHHIDEDKAIMLSTDKYAAQNPFRYQKADRLVYCNLLEHFLLHILITEEPRAKNANENEVQGIGGAVNFISKQLNDVYGGYPFTQSWRIKAADVVRNDYGSYIVMLKRLWEIIKNDPAYSVLIPKEYLAMGFDGTVYPEILKELK